MNDQQHLFQCRTCSGNVAQAAAFCPHCGEKEPSKSWPQVECERAVENKARLNAALLDDMRSLKPAKFIARISERLGVDALVVGCSLGPVYFFSGSADWIRGVTVILAAPVW